jgi:hypothetical protein
MKRHLLTFAVVMLSTMSPTVSMAEPDMWSLAERARRDGDVPDLEPIERLHVSRLFSNIMTSAPTGEISAELVQEALRLGFFMRVDGEVLVLWGREAAHGLFAIRLGPARNLLIQAPHSFFDVGTGELASALFVETGARALFLNSAHRFGGAGEDAEQFQEPDAPTAPDVAHRPFSAFQSATFGFLEASQLPFVIQIHGYRSREGEAAVISSGSALQPDDLLEPILDSLRGYESGAITGEQLPELAGRQNVQGQICANRASFAHIELSRETRRMLVSSQEERHDLVEAIVSVAGRIR